MAHDPEKWEPVFGLDHAQKKMMGEPIATSDDGVLGGRLILRQPLKGHRVGHDAILLAAAAAARAGEHAVDLGAGVGGAGLALAARVAGLKVTLVEIDETLCTIAAHNVRANNLADRVTALCADAETIDALAAGGLVAASVDHVLMNPPFNDPRRQNVSPDPRRRLAHAGDPDLLARWLRTASGLLKPNGVLTLIWRAEHQADVLAALTGDFGDVVVMPVLPRPEAAAIRVLVRAVRGARAGQREAQALVLNDAQDRPTAAVEEILRAGKAISLADRSISGIA